MNSAVGSEFDGDSLEDHSEDFNLVGNDSGAPSALPNNAAPAARGLGSNAPQQNAEPNGSESGNAHGSGYYGSLPPLSLPQPLPLADPIQVKLWEEDRKWLEEEAARQGTSISEIVRQSVHAARMQRKIAPMIIRVQKGESIKATLKDMKSTVVRLKEAVRAAKTVRMDEQSARMAFYEIIDEVKYASNRIKDLIRLLSCISSADIRALEEARAILRDLMESTEISPSMKQGFCAIIATLDLLGIPSNNFDGGG